MQGKSGTIAWEFLNRDADSITTASLRYSRYARPLVFARNVTRVRRNKGSILHAHEVVTLWFSRDLRRAVNLQGPVRVIPGAQTEPTRHGCKENQWPVYKWLQHLIIRGLLECYRPTSIGLDISFVLFWVLCSKGIRFVCCFVYDNVVHERRKQKLSRI